MATNVVKNDDNTLTVTVVIEGDVWKKALKKAFNKEKANLNLKGFRKGHVPDVIAKKYLTDEMLQYEAAFALAQPTLEAAIEENNLELVDRPSFDYKADNDSVELVYTLTVKPTPVLGEYKNLGIELEKTEALDEDVDKALLSQRKQDGDWVAVEDDVPAENGDLVNIDFAGKIDGELFNGGSASNQEVELGSGRFIPGFEEQIVGMKNGEVKDITVTFPEDYGSADLAGKEAVFTITMNSVQKEELPELNDDYIKGLNIEGVETVDAYRAHKKEELQAQLDAQAKEKHDDAVLAKVVENAEVEIPAAMIDEQVEKEMNAFKQRIAQSGLDFDTWMQVTQSNEAAMREQLREKAANDVKTELVLDAIAAAENLEVTDEAMEDFYKSLAEETGIPVENIKALSAQVNFDEMARRDKAIEFILANQE